MTHPPPEKRIADARAAIARVESEIRRVYIGQPELIRGVLTGLLACGNLLVEGSPGLGKTLLVRLLARTLRLRFSRIQFTPDLMPADITGGPALLREASGEMAVRFRPGPVFAHVVLADEINRGTPRTQAALLEAMAERSVTIAGERHELEAPFFVIATQNPIEMEGTYPLPEAQLDRFLLKLLVPFPTEEVLRRIGLETTGPSAPDAGEVLTRSELLGLQELTTTLVVAPHVAEVAARLVWRTHPAHDSSPALIKKYVRYGASPRAMQALIRAARATALLAGRAHVAVEDLHLVARPVLRHRIFRGFEAELEGISSDVLVDAVLAQR